MRRLNRADKMRQEIESKDFETFRSIILSDQIPHEDVPRLLEDNPAFSEWYKEQRVGH